VSPPFLDERHAPMTAPTMSPGGSGAPQPHVEPLASPHRSDATSTLIVILVTAFILATVGIWVAHDGWQNLSKGWLEGWISLSQISGLLASAVGLVGLMLVARLRSVERRLGLDRMFVWHKWLGGTMAVLVWIHILASVLAWSEGESLWTAILDLTGRQSYMAIATVGALLLTVVAVSSMRSIRRQMSYETWYFVHLTAYAALAFAFPHEVDLGGDFLTDHLAWWFWVGAHVAVVVALLWGRWGRVAWSMMRPLRVMSVTPVAPATVELRLSGRRLPEIEAESGQFAMLRPLRPRLWWQPHPFSLSAAPTTRGLTFTIKDRGDASGAITRLKVGDRVAVEGPFGVLTTDALDPERRLVLIVGGVGIAPARALLQRLPAHAKVGREPIVLFRARHVDDLVHYDEIRELAERRKVFNLVGASVSLAVDDPFAPSELLAAIPDLVQRQAFVCGPERMIAAARSGLRSAGMPRAHVHYEHAWW
jgi:predicted ferric reductase